MGGHITKIIELLDDDLKEELMSFVKQRFLEIEIPETPFNYDILEREMEELKSFEEIINEWLENLSLERKEKLVSKWDRRLSNEMESYLKELSNFQVERKHVRIEQLRDKIRSIRKKSTNLQAEIRMLNDLLIPHVYLSDYMPERGLNKLILEYLV